MYLNKEEMRRFANRIIYNTLEMIENNHEYNRDALETRKQQANRDRFQWEDEAEQAKKDIQDRKRKTLEEWA